MDERANEAIVQRMLVLHAWAVLASSPDACRTTSSEGDGDEDAG